MNVYDTCGIHMSNSGKPLRFVNLESEVRDAAKKQLGQMHQTVRGFGNTKMREIEYDLPEKVKQSVG